MDIKETMLELRKHVVRYGTILEDRQYTINGLYMRDTKFSMDGQEIFIKMCNGEVLHLTYN